MSAFLEAGAAARALVLKGGPGIGKTTLWEAGIEDARERGLRVLLARPSEAEAQLAYAALIDLLADIDADEVVALPSPQRHALEVATLRADPSGAPPGPSAIAVGFLSVLRSLAAAEPVLVAVDDVQWLDPASADVLVFAARRLEDDGARFLLAKRPGKTLPLERALEARGVDIVEVEPLSLGATRRMLSLRLGLTLSRRALRRVHDSTLGNPLFALEVGRSLVDNGQPELGAEIPVPDAVEDVLGTRVARLPRPARRLLLAVALSADLRASELATVASPAALDDAVERGLLLVEDGRVRPSHPLLAAAARRHSGVAERRALHLDLARVVADDVVRARHLALATERFDDGLASSVEAAAATAAARGAALDAVELAEHALRLTPADSPGRPERLLALARYLQVAGTREDAKRINQLLQPALESLPAGAPRAHAYLLLTQAIVDDNDEIQRYLERALVESEHEPALRGRVLAEMSENMSLIRVERIRDAERLAQEAVETVGRQEHILHALSWALALQGREVAHLCEGRSAGPGEVRILLSPERAAARRLAWRGEVERARDLLTRMLSIADERGEAYSYALFRLHLCQLELAIGDCAAAARLLDEWAESSDPLMWPMHERCQALIAATRGSPDEAEEWARRTISRAEELGARWDWLEARRALGVANLCRNEPSRAAADLRAVWEHTEREGVGEPGVFPVAAELVEALVELGELDEARAVGARLRDLAEAQAHPWGLISAKRCDAIVGLAGPAYDEGAAGGLVDAAAEYGTLGLRFDAARSLLGLGRAQRRHRKWGAARASLEQAAASFDGLGSPGWADAARSELARVGGRRGPREGELTPAERRVVELAADGLSNKEIARSLVVAVPTVETHLSRAYAKLGVRSRAQLVRRLSSA